MNMAVSNEISGAEIMDRLQQLAAHSEEANVLTRTFLTPTHKSAALLIKAWMEETGMQAGLDPIGNIIGRYEGDRPGLPALLLGSHYDTVRNAGRFDGMLGIISAIACVKALQQNGERLPFAIEVIGFADEEGVRFNATLLGSRAIAGNFDFALLENTDRDGITMAEALQTYGLDPARISEAAYSRDQVLAYVETHIEQGPVLLSEDLPVAIVTAIAGATRFIINVNGLAGHAGTVPMHLRRDAAAAAAEAILFVEQRCSRQGGLVGTVGQLSVPNGATNVIPGSAEFSLDIRSGDDAVREAVIEDILREFDAIAGRRNVSFAISKTHEASAVSCSPRLMQQLDAAIRRTGIQPRRLLSGAGHDAMALPGLTDVAMLFVRCGNGGISHHPAETMTLRDAEISTAVLLDFIRHFQPV